MRHFRWLCIVLAAICVALPVRADHVVASRHALVKAGPERDAATLMTLERGDELTLASGAQSNGYYQVELHNGAVGYVYRTFVRRVAGNSPGSSSSLGAASSGGTSSTWVLPPETSAESTFVFAGSPLSTNPNFPVKVLPKQFFVIGYSEERRNPAWVCYAIGPKSDLVAYPRKSFATDRDTDAKISTDDYVNCGFSRGHMAPRFAISSRFGKAGNDSTFIMSNVTPQYQEYNDGQWGELEELVAGKKAGTNYIPGWADRFHKVWVTVGPIFDKDREPLNAGVEVPNAFYCIVVEMDSAEPHAIAFILDHKNERYGDLAKDLCSIREIEQRADLDFFNDLPRDWQERLETTKQPRIWPTLATP